MRHGINWRKTYAKVGDRVPVYPFPWLGEPFIGIVERVKKNRFGRVSYVVNGKEVMAEELLPAIGQQKLRMRA